MAKRRERRREPIEIQKSNGDSRDERGHVQEDWNELFCGRAKVRQLRETEFNSSPQVTGEAVYEFETWFVPDCEDDFDLSCRIVWRDRIFNLTTIDNVDSLNRTWRILGTEDTSPRENV